MKNHRKPRRRLSPSELECYKALKALMNEDQLAEIGQKEIAQRLNCTVSRISQILASLKKKGYVQRTRRPVEVITP
jgi:DNA-binding MarR family transcriptional regulator